MENEELISQAMQMIANGGEAQSIAIHAIELARQGNIEEAKKEISRGEESLKKSHEVNTKLLVKEANNEKIDFSLFLIHATEHMTVGQVFLQMAKEFVNVYEDIKNNGKEEIK